MGRYVLGRKERRRREGEENDWWSNGSGLGNVNGNNGGLEKKKIERKDTDGQAMTVFTKRLPV